MSNTPRYKNTWNKIGKIRHFILSLTSIIAWNRQLPQIVVWKQTMGYFLRWKRFLPAGAWAISFWASFRVSFLGSVSFGTFTFFLPSEIYGP